MDWSEDQKKVINAAGSDVLVSAAAGSGKTTVMVERILKLISDPQASVSLDELVVMTFTNAAAAGMKEKLRRALDERIAMEPDNKKLLMERSLLPRASISTIHSYCMELIRQHIEELDIEPDFRLADEGETRLMRSDALERLFEELYEIIYMQGEAGGAVDGAGCTAGSGTAGEAGSIVGSGTGIESVLNSVPADISESPEQGGCRLKYLACGFERLIGTFNVRTMEMKTADVIELIYRFLMGRPAPFDYIEAALNECGKESKGNYSDTAWYRDFIRDIKRELMEQRELLVTAERMCHEERGPLKYSEPVNECIALIDRLLLCGDYRELHEAVYGFGRFMTIPRKTKKDDWDPDIQSFVRDTRDDFKEYTGKLKKGALLLEEEDLARSAAGSADIHAVLLLLTKEFMERYAAIKREKNVLDFDDLEHMALRLLYTRVGERGDRAGSKDSAPAQETGAAAASAEQKSGEEPALAAQEEGTVPALAVQGFEEKYEPSALADRLAHGIKEIMVDEYQDSSEVQEALIKALSAGRFGRNDVFMVGDVKQSIYRFRNARPELFTQKLNSFSREEEAPGRKIELNANYRSRSEVLDAVNDVFDRVMTSSFGGIEYDSAARLKAGAAYEACPGSAAELLVLDTKTADGDKSGQEPGGGEYEDMSSEELEFKLIAFRIHELVNKAEPDKSFKVRDAVSGRMRPASYGDIAVLVRKRRSAARLRELLEQNRIPAYFEESEGYFEAAEVNMMLCLLGILDNPMQDIPLVTVLRGPIGGFDDNELALIRAAYARKAEEGVHTEAGEYYRALKAAAQDPGGEKDGNCGEGIIDDELRSRICGFLSLLDSLKRLADIMPVHVLLSEIYNRTGYYNYASALPGGAVRRKNLDMLLEKAESFGKTNYQGLFNFIRYIESLKKYRQDHGEASVVSENDEIVRIPTIHKSKGLEYRIVFLAGAGASLAAKRSEGSIVIGRYGLGSDYIDPETNIKYPGLKKAFIKKLHADEEKAEEQRLLYVAMTRAMEKLIITASGSRLIEKSGTLAMGAAAVMERDSGAGKLPVSMIKSAGSYLDWIIMAASAGSSHIDIKYLDLDYMRNTAYSEAFSEGMSFMEIKAAAVSGRDTKETLADEIAAKLSACFAASYAYEAETLLRPKTSVSELNESSGKGAVDHEQPGYDAQLDFDDEVLDIDDEGYPYKAARGYGYDAVSAGGEAVPAGGLAASVGTAAVPGGTAGAGGARRGTAFHRAMELIGFDREPEAQLEALFADIHFPDGLKGLLDKRAVLGSLGSGLAGRMKAACEKGLLHREQHFMAGFPARTLDPAQDSDELQLLQGIIDAWFEEDGELVIVDYKTDRVHEPEELIRRYGVQLGLYKRALTQLTGKNVRESIIYSTFLDREIVI